MILVTGGAGYIGSHTNKQLNREGFGTVIYDSLARGHRESVKWGEFVLGDLSDIKQLQRCFEIYPIQAVMHFGGLAYVGESVAAPDRYYHNNVINTLNLLHTMRENSVKMIVFSSTCSTYGNPIDVPMTEDHPQHPINPYGKSKLMIEMILKDDGMAYGIKHVNLRYFNAAGADPGGEIGELHDPETHIIPLVLDAAIGKSQGVRIYGTDYDTPDGTCIRDYIHVSDLAEAHILSLAYLKAGGESSAFNLSNGVGFSVRQVIEAAKTVTGLPIEGIEVARRPGDPAILIGSSEKAREIVSWEPHYKRLEDIIETAWQWHRRSL